MSLELRLDTLPCITVAAGALPNAEACVELAGEPNGDNMFGEHVIRIGPKDFAAVVYYWLTNSDLLPEDPRTKLIMKIAELNIKEGYNGPDSRRLG